MRFPLHGAFAVALLVHGCKEKPDFPPLEEAEACRIEGRVYKHLANVPSPDCNTCTCMNGGVICTLMLCGAFDSSVAVDAAVDGGETKR